MSYPDQPDQTASDQSPAAPAPDQEPTASAQPAEPAPTQSQPQTEAPPAASEPSASTAQPSPSTEDLSGQLAQMRTQLEALQARAASGQLTSQPVDEDLVKRVEQLREAFSDWPQNGDKFAEKPQPFELQKLGLPQPGVTRDHLPPGEADTISPVVVSHSLPTIAPGQAGQPVSLLAQLLGKLGYPTTISRGQNHAFAFDDSVIQAVEAFKRDWHVIEDSSGFRSAEEAARVVGPWIWEALLRATGALKA